MSHISVIIESHGPIIVASIGVSIPRRAALFRANLPIPLTVDAHLLIDTGATQTAIDPTIIAQLGVSPTGEVLIHTPSTQNIPHACNTYDVSLSFAGAGAAKLFSAIPIIESDFSSQGIHGLIGRDILSSAHMSYIGPDNFVSLTFS